MCDTMKHKSETKQLAARPRLYSPLSSLAKLEAAGPLLPQELDEGQVGCVVARRILHRTLQESEAFGVGHWCNSAITTATTEIITIYLHLFTLLVGCVWVWCAFGGVKRVGA